MRYRGVLLGVYALLSGGCSSLIASTGVDILRPTTREEIHARFGEPIATGTEDGEAWEDYHTRTKIADPYTGPGYFMGYAFSLGLVELVWFPEQLAQAAWGTIVGRDVRFSYDEAGRLSYAWIDGTPHRALARARRIAEQSHSPPKSETENALGTPGR